MNIPSTTRAGAQAGVSMVELAIGASLLAVLGVAAMSLVGASRDGAASARLVTMQTKALRSASTTIREDLAQATASRLVVDKVPGQSDVVTLQRPMLVAGSGQVWGAFDPFAPPAARMRADHFTRFVVVPGDAGRELRRQTLAPDMTVIAQEVVARGLAGGADSPAGLTVDPSGDMWRVTIGMARLGNKPAESIQFDVALKN